MDLSLASLEARFFFDGFTGPPPLPDDFGPVRPARFGAAVPVVADTAAFSNLRRVKWASLKLLSIYIDYRIG